MNLHEANPGLREIWKVRHQRQGNIVIRLIEDPRGRELFQVEILDGRVAQRTLGLKDKNEAASQLMALTGEVVKMRSSFIEYLKRLEVVGL